MILLRGAKKFLSFAGIRPEAGPELNNPSPFSEWYVNLFYVDRAKYLIFTHASTLFSFIVPKIRKQDIIDLPGLFRKELSRIMYQMKCPSQMMTKILQECDGLKIARTVNRSVLASMTDLVIHAKAHLSSQDDAVTAASKINMLPMGALKYKYPVEQFSQLHGFPVNIDIGKVFKLEPLDAAQDLETFLHQELGADVAVDLAGAASLRVAQELIYEAWERSDSFDIVRLARKALDISPLCADAYNLLAQMTAQNDREAAEFYSQAVNAGRQALGKDFFKRNKGHFWGMTESRPYMRALGGLQESSWNLGKYDEAIHICRDMLRLNPNDNQGMRYVLIRYLIKLSRHDELEKFMEGGSYRNDCAAEWRFTRALLWFIKEGDTDRSRKILRTALDSNKFVLSYLKKKNFRLKSLPATLTMGGKDEAQYYAHELGDVWRLVPGAIEWLEKTIGDKSQH